MNGDKNSYYFTHDIGARNDVKVMRLLRMHGYQGYGWFWAIIEIMAQATNYEITSEDTRDLAWEFRVTDETMRDFFRDLAEIGLVVMEESRIYSPSLRRRMEALETSRLARTERARRAGEASAEARSTKAEQESNGSSTQVEPKERKKDREEEIYERYKTTVRAGAKQDAIKSIKKRLGEYTADELLAAVERYSAKCAKNKTEEQYRVQANNFFGMAERFRDYLTDEVPARPVPQQTICDNPDMPEHLRGRI